MRKTVAFLSVLVAALPGVAGAQTAYEPLPPVPVVEPLYPKASTQRVVVASAQTYAPARRYEPAPRPILPITRTPVPKPTPTPLPTRPVALALVSPVVTRSATLSPAGDKPADFARTAPTSATLVVGQPFVLPGNTSIALRLESSLSSRETRRGDAVRLRVARDVVIDGHIVVPRGTSAIGEVISRGNSGGFGKGGKIEIEARSFTLNGQSVALSGSMLERGSGAKAGKLILFGVLSGAMGLAQVRGDDAIIGTETIMSATTREDVAFK